MCAFPFPNATHVCVHTHEPQALSNAARTHWVAVIVYSKCVSKVAGVCVQAPTSWTQACQVWCYYVWHECMQGSSTSACKVQCSAESVSRCSGILMSDVLSRHQEVHCDNTARIIPHVCASKTGMDMAGYSGHKHARPREHQEQHP